MRLSSFNPRTADAKDIESLKVKAGIVAHKIARKKGEKLPKNTFQCPDCGVGVSRIDTLRIHKARHCPVAGQELHNQLSPPPVAGLGPEMASESYEAKNSSCTPLSLRY